MNYPFIYSLITPCIILTVTTCIFRLSALAAGTLQGPTRSQRFSHIVGCYLGMISGIVLVSVGFDMIVSLYTYGMPFTRSSVSESVFVSPTGPTFWLYVPLILGLLQTLTTYYAFKIRTWHDKSENYLTLLSLGFTPHSGAIHFQDGLSPLVIGLLLLSLFCAICGLTIDHASLITCGMDNNQIFYIPIGVFSLEIPISEQLQEDYSDSMYIFELIQHDAENDFGDDDDQINFSENGVESEEDEDSTEKISDEETLYALTTSSKNQQTLFSHDSFFSVTKGEAEADHYYRKKKICLWGESCWKWEGSTDFIDLWASADHSLKTRHVHPAVIPVESHISMWFSNHFREPSVIFQTHPNQLVEDGDDQNHSTDVNTPSLYIPMMRVMRRQVNDQTSPLRLHLKKRLPPILNWLTDFVHITIGFSIILICPALLVALLSMTAAFCHARVHGLPASSSDSFFLMGLMQKVPPYYSVKRFLASFALFVFLLQVSAALTIRYAISRILPTTGSMTGMLIEEVDVRLWQGSSVTHFICSSMFALSVFFLICAERVKEGDESLSRIIDARNKLQNRHKMVLMSKNENIGRF